MGAQIQRSTKGCILEHFLALLSLKDFFFVLLSHQQQLQSCLEPEMQLANK